MGYTKARLSSLPVKELELVYLGCLVAVLLAFPLRPADYTDMFRYADPAASLLDPMMSDMIFAIANNSTPEKNSSPLDTVATADKKLWDGSEKINGNSTTELYVSFESRRRPWYRHPTLLENNLPGAVDSKTSQNSPAMFSYVFSLSTASGYEMRCFPGTGKRKGDICHKYDPSHQPWYMSSKIILKRTTLDRFLYSSHVQLGAKEEEKLEKENDTGSLFLSEIEQSENKIACFALNSNYPVSDDLLVCHNVSYNSCTGLPSVRSIDTSSNNDLKYTIKVIFITFGCTIVFAAISIFAWKQIKNLTCLGLDHGLNTLVLSKSTLDESCLIDHTLYEMLLGEAILISSGSSSGEVYKIKFFELECAMKVFFSHAIMDFRRESVIVANLDHPNIIKFFCCFRKSFIIMELMDEDLYSFIKKIREKNSDYELSLEVALDVMLQIAEGMSYLHEEGIAHQDLKSLNILLKLQGEPHSSNFRIIAKIGDFGSARSFDPRHPRGFFLRPKENIAGTRSWKAPELFPPRGGFLTKVFGMACEILPKPLDIYGFAIICSELLTKRIPFSNTNETRNVHVVELRAGLRPSLPSHSCPAELITLIEDCWQTNPQSRPEFDEICVRLRRLIEVQCYNQMPSAS